MLNDIKDNYNVNSDKLLVINNPITNEFKLKDKAISQNPIKLITVARFSKEKGVQRILELLSKFNEQFHYTLIGDAPEIDEILLLIKKYDLQNKVTHIPFTREVERYLGINDYYLQGSYVEGFPNALLESCVIGTPVIAFNVPGGTKEIVINGVNGYLVNNESEFLEKLIENKNWDSKEVRNTVIKHFSSDKILKQYEQLFIDILK